MAKVENIVFEGIGQILREVTDKGTKHNLRILTVNIINIISKYFSLAERAQRTNTAPVFVVVSS